MSELYPQILAVVKNSGDLVVTRGKEVMEVENMAFTLEDPLQPIVLQSHRKFNSAYAVLEALSMFMRGSAIVEPFLFHNPNMKNFLNPKTQLFDGSYAERLSMYNQLRYCYGVLKEDLHSRRAVLDFYNAAHDQHESLDICCTLNMIFRVREGKLNATVFMRGNDILWGTPYNFAMFTFIQNVMATWLGLEVGTYCHMVGSAHFYTEREEEIVDVMAHPHDLKTNHPLEVMPRWDIEDVEETFIEISKFFVEEQAYRLGRVKEPTFSSTVLQHFWDKVVKPSCDKRLDISSVKV